MIAPNGTYLGPGGLTRHLNAGGCASVAKLQKYFRVTNGQLERLVDGESHWSKCGFAIVSLAREFDCVACDMPEVK